MLTLSNFLLTYVLFGSFVYLNITTLFSTTGSRAFNILSKLIYYEVAVDPYNKKHY